MEFLNHTNLSEQAKQAYGLKAPELLNAYQHLLNAKSGIQQVIDSCNNTQITNHLQQVITLLSNTSPDVTTFEADVQKRIAGDRISEEEAQKAVIATYCLGEINQALNQYDYDVLDQIRALPSPKYTAQATGIRHNCLYHSVAIATVDYITAHPKQAESVLKHFLQSFNQRHQCALSTDQFLTFLRQQGGGIYHPQIIEALFAPTLRDIVHKRAEGDNTFDTGSISGFENEIALDHLATILQLNIEAISESRSDLQIFRPGDDSKPTDYRSCSIFSDFKARKITLKCNSNETHYDPLTHSEFKQSQLPNHCLPFLHCYNTIANPDPMISATRALLTQTSDAPYKQLEPMQLYADELQINWQNILLDLALSLSILGVLPVLFCYDSDRYFTLNSIATAG